MKIPAILLSFLNRFEVVTLVAIFVVAGALWSFVALADEMLEGDLGGFDERVLLALRTPGDVSNPIGGEHVEIAMRDLTALGGVSVLTLITLTVLMLLLLHRQRSSALFMGVAVMGGLLISNLAKTGFSRPRPDLVPHAVDAATASFPSGHSMMAAVTYLTIAVMIARVEKRMRLKVFYFAAAIVVTVMVGLSRVYLGVHWPTDVLAGWMLGAAWALGVWLLARALAKRGTIEPEGGIG